MADYLRTVNTVLFFMLVGQSLSILFYYFKAYRRTVHAHEHTKGLLPLHVLVVTLMFLALSAEALVTNLQALNRPLRFWTYFNTVVFALANLGLYLVLKFEWRRFYPKRVNDE